VIVTGEFIQSRTRCVRDRDVVEPYSRGRRRFIRSHPEAHRDILPSQIWPKVNHRVDVAAAIGAPRHSPRQRVVRFPGELSGVATTHKAPSHVGIGNIKEFAAADARCGNFQHVSIPEDSVTEFRVEVVPEAHHCISSNGHVRAGNHLVTDPILIGYECVIRRAIR